MLSRELSISARGLGKSYTIRHNQPRHSTLREAIVHLITRRSRLGSSETFWALRDISFDVRQGEIIGIIGRNGAGKSTLLKILSRIVRPTVGEADIYGRVGSLLEVGTGFHQELTGRENVFLSGTILGMRQQEIRQQFDAIVDFAGVEQFLDTPVKRYSSGMYVRLAFAVAAHVNPEILLVDEVLAVGDAEFQSKCLGKMRDVATSGRTVLFVSHHMHSVKQLCERGIVLQAGAIEFIGDVESALAYYVSSLKPAEGMAETGPRQGTGEYRYVDVTAVKPAFQPGENKVFRYKVRHELGMMGRMYASAVLFNESGSELAQFDSRFAGMWLHDQQIIEGVFIFRSPWLKPGNYRLDMYLCSLSGIIDCCQAACVFHVTSELPYDNTASAEAIHMGVVLADFDWASDQGPATADDSNQARLAP